MLTNKVFSFLLFNSNLNHLSTEETPYLAKCFELCIVARRRERANGPTLVLVFNIIETLSFLSNLFKHPAHQKLHKPS